MGDIYYMQSVGMVNNIHATSHELELGDYEGGATEVVENVGKETYEFTHVWTTNPDVPGSDDWASGTYELGIDVGTAGANLLYGPNGMFGHIARINSAASSDLETKILGSPTSGTGTKTFSDSWDPSSGSSSDRLEALIEVENTGHQDQDLGIWCDSNTNSYVDVPIAIIRYLDVDVTGSGTVDTANLVLNKLQLATVITGNGAVDALLSIQAPLATTINGSGTVDALLSIQAPLVAAIDGAGAVDASLVLNKLQLAVAVDGTGTVGALLSIRAPLVVAINGAGAVVADLTKVGAIKALAADIVGSATVAVNLTTKTRYWVGATSSWNTSSNWAYTDGGAGGAGVPTANEDVIFNGSDTTDCTIDAPAACKNLIVKPGYTGTLDNSTYTVAVGGIVYVSDGTLALGPGKWTVQGSFSVIAPAVTTRDSANVIEFAGSGTINVDYTRRISQGTVSGVYTVTDYYGARLTITGTLTDISAGITCNGVTVNGGTLTGTGSIISNGSIIFTSGTWNIATSRLNSADNTISANTYTTNFTFNKSWSSSKATKVFSSGAYIFDGNVVFNSDSTAHEFELDWQTNNPTVEFKGLVTFTESVGTITWLKSSDVNAVQFTDTTIWNDDTVAGLASIGDVTVDGTSLTLDSDLPCDDFTGTVGTLATVTYDIVCGGDFVCAANFTATASTPGSGIITVGGTFDLNGTTGNEITWTNIDLDITGVATAHYTDVTDSDASVGVDVDATDNCTNNGSNPGWVFAAVKQLVVAVDGTGAANALLSVQAPLATAITGTGTVDALLSVQAPLATAIDGTGAANALLSIQALLATAIDGTGTVDALLSVQAPLATTITGVGTVDALLSIQAPLVAAIDGTGTVDALLSIQVPLATVIDGTGTVDALLSIQAPLVVAIDGTGTVVADLTKVTALKALATTITGVGTVDALLSIQAPLIAAIDGTGTVDALLSIQAPLATVIDGTGTVDALLSIQAPLVTAINGTGTVNANLTLNKLQLTATINGTGTVDALLSIQAPLAAVIDGTGTVVADLIKSAVQPLVANITGGATVGANLILNKLQLATDIVGSATVDANLTQTKGIAADITGNALVEALLSIQAPLAVDISGSGELAGNLIKYTGIEATIACSGLLAGSFNLTLAFGASVQSIGTLEADLSKTSIISPWFYRSDSINRIMD